MHLVQIDILRQDSPRERRDQKDANGGIAVDPAVAGEIADAQCGCEAKNDNAEVGKMRMSSQTVPAPPKPLWAMPSPMNAHLLETTKTLSTAQDRATLVAVSKAGTVAEMSVFANSTGGEFYPRWAEDAKCPGKMFS
jgi:hypothetical protein